MAVWSEGCSLGGCCSWKWLRAAFLDDYEPVLPARAEPEGSVGSEASVDPTAPESSVERARCSVAKPPVRTMLPAQVPRKTADGEPDEPCPLLLLPDELLRTIAIELWSPVVPAFATAFSGCCKRVSCAVQGALREREWLVLKVSSSELARWGSLVLGPPWHMVRGRVQRGVLQSYARYLIVQRTAPAEGILAALTRHWKLGAPQALVRIAGGGEAFALDPALKEAIVRGLAAVGRECWLITDGSGSGGQGATVQAALVGCARGLLDSPGMSNGPKRRPVLLAFLDLVQCGAALTEGKRGATRRLDQKAAPTPGNAHLERHHTHFVLCEEPARLERDLLRLLVAGGAPCTFVLINGTSLSLTHLQWHLEQGWPAVVVAGTGKAADCLLRILMGGEVGHEDGWLGEPAAECARYPRLITVARLADGDIDGAIRKAHTARGTVCRDTSSGEANDADVQPP